MEQGGQRQPLRMYISGAGSSRGQYTTEAGKVFFSGVFAIDEPAFHEQIKNVRPTAPEEEDPYARKS